ncbi:hypothetical protein MRS76_15415 [Rhizobiaceae bacterium n13]|uniref:hypothetical protein n=1 Tax=Ferirhizobium litorale TaxID=2927786 RepID=UPI0024B2C013|nr:hypothetical protein [Fererhizobium litorale]MDI7863346.1 hypothetical protein [Fererhizobium litorale]
MLMMLGLLWLPPVMQEVSEPIQRHDEAVKTPTSKKTMSLTSDTDQAKLDNRD